MNASVQQDIIEMRSRQNSYFERTEPEKKTIEPQQSLFTQTVKKKPQSFIQHSFPQREIEKLYNTEY